MSASEVGVGYVRLLPSMRGFSAAASKELDSALRGPADKAGQKAGSELASGIGKGAQSAVGDLDRVGRGFDDIAQEARAAGGDVGKSFDGMESDARGLDAAIDRIDFKALGAAGLSGGLAATLEDATVSAGKLHAQLGLTGDEAKDVDAVATRVFRNNFGESMGEAFQVTGLVQQGIGGIGEELEARVSDIFRISDAFGHVGADTQILVEDVRAMASAFPGEDESLILDRIAAGFQLGAGTAGDFGDTLQEYPRHFAAIGLGAGDLVNFLTTGMQAGARNTDLLGDAVKEFGIRVKTAGDTGQEALKQLFPPGEAQRLIADFSRGGDAGRDAFYKTLDGLHQVKDPMDKYNLAIGLFGTKGEDLVGVLDEMTPAFTAMKDETVGATDATDLLDQQYGGFGAKLESFKRGIQTSVIGPLGDIGGAASGVAEPLANAGLALFSLKGLGFDVSGALSKIGPVMGGIGKAAMALFTNPIGIAIIAAVAATILIIKHWDKVKAALSAAWGFISSTAMAVWGGISAFFKQWWPLILGIFTGGIGLVVGLVVKNWDWIKEKTSAAWNFVTGVVRGAIDFFTSIPGHIASAFSSLVDIISAPFRWAFDRIKSFWNSTVGGFGFTIPSWVPGLSGKGFRIPYMGMGGIVMSGGMALVGESGPELISANRGASVRPLDTTTMSPRDLFAGDVGYSRSNPGAPARIVLSADGEGEFLRWIRKTVRVQGGDVQMALGQS